MGSQLRFLARLSTLEACWSVLDTEPGMDDLANEASPKFLEKLAEAGIYPFHDTDRETRLFLARFEICRPGQDPKYPAAFTEGDAGFIHFLGGFPVDCIEMLVAIGEFSSIAKEDEDLKVSADPGNDKVFPGIPSKGLFKWPENEKILLNLTAIPIKNLAKWFAKNLEGEPKPKSPKWWFQTRLKSTNLSGEKIKFPVPGEFLGLGVRIWPGKYWGHQKSNPFIYSGNFFDTVFYTSGVITEIIEDDLNTFYKVIWHGKEIEEVYAMASDYALYKIGDRVTILKDVATEKTTQLWKDDDMKYFGGSEGIDPADITWQIVPIVFYGLEKEGG
jgi:hypothetical protein